MTESRPTYYSDAMTWLNGRALEITIIDDDGFPARLWSVTNEGEGGCTIENAIYEYTKERDIDILKEIGEA